MAKYKDMVVAITGRSAKAIKCTFNEGSAEEVEDVWVPLSVLEHPVDESDEDEDGDTIISIARWFMKKNEIPYHGDEESTQGVREAYSVDTDQAPGANWDDDDNGIGDDEIPF